MRIVISQPMYFPWVGLLEQICLSDIFVHYADVQYTRGFYNRVQIKTELGITWITVPLRRHHQKQSINEILVDDRTDWRTKHRESLRQSYLNAPFLNDMLALVDSVFATPAQTLADISIASIGALADYFSLAESRRFLDSRDLNIGGRSSERLRDIVAALGGDIYITGHGARNYLDHELFDKTGISVEYMRYKCTPYPQQHGDFTPYVTALDLVANCGKDGKKFIQPETINWKEFLNESN